MLVKLTVLFKLRRVFFFFFQEHKEGQLISMPQEVCRSFVKITAEVLGSPPDLELLTIIFNFLLAVHPPTNTYVCHNPTNFYFSLHIGRYNHFCLILAVSTFVFFFPFDPCLLHIHWMTSVLETAQLHTGNGTGQRAIQWTRHSLYLQRA